MELVSCDVAIVGGGAAGLRAAIAAAEQNPNLKIALISKVYPVRSHTVSAEGGLSGVVREYDSFDQHSYDTIKGSDFLADQDAVEFFVREAGKEIMNLEQWGCPWSREKDGRVAVRAFGGMSVKRTVFAADKTGFYMLHSLFERSLKYENILRFDEWFVTALFSDEEKIQGLCALEIKTGKLVAVEAKAVIVATGGCGRLYRFTTNGYIKTGDGIALAYRTGAALKDMEFVQFHPTGLPKTGILITEAARGEGGYLLNKNGERFLKKYLPEKMELGPRDIISRAIISEISEGRGIDSPWGSYVHLDIRHLGKKLIDEKLPLVREMAMEYQGVDPVSEPIPVRPVMHYFMGGIHTDINGQTSLRGLFAAGETACVSINGANRLGSNSLSECLVFGKVAGERAAEFANSHREEIGSFPESFLHDEEKRLGDLKKQSGSVRLSTVREELQEAMDLHAGILRDAPGMKKGLEIVVALQEKFHTINLDDRSEIFNTQFLALLELESILKVAELILRAALLREESRGAHFRTDFPKRNDQQFLKHTLFRNEGGALKTSEIPITITKWKPEERKY